MRTLQDFQNDLCDEIAARVARSQAPKNEVVTIVSQAMFEAANLDGMDLKSTQVLYVDVPRCHTYKGASLGTRMRKNIEAACQNIAAIWDSITL